MAVRRIYATIDSKGLKRKRLKKFGDRNKLPIENWALKFIESSEFSKVLSIWVHGNYNIMLYMLITFIFSDAVANENILIKMYEFRHCLFSRSILYL